MTKILILEARFYNHLADMLIDGATKALEAQGVTFDRMTVPGVLELPAALAMVVASGAAYDGYVTLGTAIRGESDHYDYVCNECMRGLNDLAIKYNLALGNGVLTVHNEAQALKRADPSAKNLGGMAANACLRMLEIKRQLKLQ